MTTKLDHTRATQYTGGKTVIIEGDVLRCPHCNETDDERDGPLFRYLEDIVCHREVVGIKKGVVTVDGYYESDEGYDDGMHPRLECQECYKQCETPDAGVEFE